MKKTDLNFENWQVKCIPDAGARISLLKYKGFNLLTSEPAYFNTPLKDYGEYETRPVYGYDDCFPSVDACLHPVDGFRIRDHGQVCWMSWQTEIHDNKLICTADCDKPKSLFTRTLEFYKDTLIWKFEISNKSRDPLVFLHVVHPLMPLREISKIEVPAFEKVFDEVTSKEQGINSSTELNTCLLNIKPGNFKMLLLTNVHEGFINLSFLNGLKIRMVYDRKLFPTIGIWWNNCGYPDEKGLQRCECAFEPVPGTNSNLEKSFKDGVFLTVDPAGTFNWELTWRITKE